MDLLGSPVSFSSSRLIKSHPWMTNIIINMYDLLFCTKVGPYCQLEWKYTIYGLQKKSPAWSKLLIWQIETRYVSRDNVSLSYVWKYDQYSLININLISRYVTGQYAHIISRIRFNVTILSEQKYQIIQSVLESALHRWFWQIFPTFGAEFFGLITPLTFLLCTLQWLVCPF